MLLYDLWNYVQINLLLTISYLRLFNQSFNFFSLKLLRRWSLPRIMVIICTSICNQDVGKTDQNISKTFWCYFLQSDNFFKVMYLKRYSSSKKLFLNYALDHSHLGQHNFHKNSFWRFLCPFSKIFTSPLTFLDLPLSVHVR